MGANMHTEGRNEYIVQFEELAAEVDQALAELQPSSGAGHSKSDQAVAPQGTFLPTMTRAERRKREAEYALIS